MGAGIRPNWRKLFKKGASLETDFSVSPRHEVADDPFVEPEEPVSTGVAVEEDGVEEGTGIDRFDFTTGLNVSVAGTQATISATGGGGGGGTIEVPPVTITADTTADVDDFMYLADTSGGAVTLTLPPVADVEGEMFGLKNIDSSNDATMIQDPSDPSFIVNSSTSGVLRHYGDTLVVISDGVNWQAVSEIIQRVQLPPLTLLSVYTNNAPVVWTNMPSALTELGGATASRAAADLSFATDASEIQIAAHVHVAGSGSAELRVQFSYDESTWDYLDLDSGPALDISSVGTQVGVPVGIDESARGEVILRVVGINGNGSADPSLSQIQVQLRENV